MNTLSTKLNLLLPPGTQVVTLCDKTDRSGVVTHRRGSVGSVVKAPVDPDHAYRVRFHDGAEVSFHRSDLAIRKNLQREGLERPEVIGDSDPLYDYVIYRCVVGSRAYGLDQAGSDIDRRGIYLPPADRHWSLSGAPEQLENDETQECYWELQKFLALALKANPNVLECLYAPIVETATPLAEELLSMKSAFLSRLIYQTYNGYVMSQFRKLEQDIRTTGSLKWKHAMHLIRLLLAGVTALQEGFIPVEVGVHRENLLAIRRGEMSWEEVDGWRFRLHHDFDQALAGSSLPDRPDYEAANAFLLRARRFMVNGT